MVKFNSAKYIIISILVVACGHSHNCIEPIDVTDGKVQCLEDVASDIKIMPLRDRDSLNLIGDIYSLKSYGERIFLYDDRARKILYYDDGIYGGQIDKVGRGPEEYVDIGTFAYDAEHDILTLFDRNTRKLIFYSCATVRMVREMQLDYYIAALEYITDGVYLVVREQTSEEDNNAAVVILDTDNNSITSSLSITPIQGDLLSDLAVTRADDGVIITVPGYVNRVYRADVFGFTELSTIFFGRHGADRKFWEGKREDPFYVEELLNSGPASAIAPSYYIGDGTCERFWYVSRYSYDMHSQPVMSLCVCDGSKCVTVSELVIDGIEGGLQPLCATNDYYFTLVYPYQISNQTDKLSPLAAEIAAVADYENNNPTVVAFKL